MFLPILLLSARITIDTDQVLNPISPSMTGACIEDVNHEIYGGLYAQRIFGESFEEPPPGASPAGWTAYGGNWYPDGSGICVRASDGAKIVRHSPDWGDGTVEAQILVSNDWGENAGFLVRESGAGVGADNFDGYEISLDTRQRRLILGKHRHDFKLLESVRVPIEPGRWEHLKVTLEGPRIRAFIEGESAPRLDFTDYDRPFLTGAVALRTWQSDASFRDVVINRQPAPVSFASSPGVSSMWDPLGKGGFSVEGGAFNGSLCQKIVNDRGRVGVANRGLNRWGISIHQGHRMAGRIYLKGDSVPVTVQLESADGTRVYASRQVRPGKEWTKTPFTLNPSATDPNARFCIWVEGRGSVWLDQVSLFDADAERFKGLPVRRDIVESMLRSGFSFLRYGGTMVNVPGYRWKNMIGDRDRRPPYVGHWYPCSTNGFGIFDFLEVCEKANFRSAFAMNAEESPQDAADLADYLTSATSTPWGRRRAEDGHPAPYHPDFIEIGNEEFIGNPSNEAIAHYAERFRLLETAMHGRNPNLKLVCAAWWLPDLPAMKTVFDAIDGRAAAWDIHVNSDAPDAGVDVERELTDVRRRFLQWNPRTTLRTGVFEENGGLHNMQRALGHATTINATRRLGDFVLVDCPANCLQPLHQNDNGWDQGQVFFTAATAWLMPPALSQQIIRAVYQPLRVVATAEPGLDVLAAKSLDGKALSITVVNLADQAVSAEIELKGFWPRRAVASVISGALNADTASVHPTAISLSAEGLKTTFPPHSISTVRCRN